MSGKRSLSADVGKSESEDRLTLSNGVVLRIKPVPLLTVRRAVQSVERPKVPRVLIPEKGREEENPSDPAYLAAKEAYEAETTERAIDTLLLFGVELESVPKGMDGPDDDGWLRKMKLLGINVDPDNPDERLLTWLRCYAIVSLSDFTALQRAAGKSVGLSEEEVQAAADSFRGGEVRGSDNGPSPETA